MPSNNEKLLRDFLALWAIREPEKMVAMFAEDGVYDNVPNKSPMNGRAEILKWLNACFEHLTRIDVELLHVAENGEWLLSERMDTHVAGDKHMPLPVMNACRIVNGKIVMFRDYYCRETVKELGMM